MKFIRNKIRGSYIIDKVFFKDTRGIFYRDYCKKILKKKKINFDIKQTSIVFNDYNVKQMSYSKKCRKYFLTGAIIRKKMRWERW